MSALVSRLLPIALAALVATVPAAATAKPAKAAKATKASKAAKPARPEAAPQSGPVNLELVHHLHADKIAPVQKIVDAFNAANPGYEVTLSTRDWSQGKPPELLLLDHDDESRFLDGKPRYRPLHQVMAGAKKPLSALRAPQQMSPTSLDSRGRVLALPVGLTTPIMYYNRDAFRKAGLDPDAPPKTWWDLQQALGKLFDAGYACPYTSSWPAWIHVENLSAWHNEPFATVGKKSEGPLRVNGMVEVKHLAMMSSWYKSSYMHIYGRGDEGDHKFAGGECAVLTSDSSAFPQIAAGAKFDVGVGALPFHDDVRGAPQNTLADGPNLWAAAGKSKAEYGAIAKFVSYLLTPETQIEIQRTTGALPLNRAGVLAASSELLGSELPHIRVALQQLTYKPVTADSRRARLAERPEIRGIINEELEAIWANKKPAKEALDSAVARSRGVPCC